MKFKYLYWIQKRRDARYWKFGIQIEQKSLLDLKPTESRPFWVIFQLWQTPPLQLSASVLVNNNNHHDNYYDPLYLCQAHILLLDGVLKAVTEGSGQQQICRLADHVVDLGGTEDKETHELTESHTPFTVSKSITNFTGFCSDFNAIHQKQSNVVKWKENDS